MAYLFDTGILAANDSSGASLSGAKLTFYDNGTTTLKNTYPTKADAEAGTNANANPVVADANGRWGAIWLDDTFYTVKFQPADGSFTRTRDDIGGALADLASTASGIGAGLVGFSHAAAYAAGTVGKRLQKTVYASDYGAVGDYDTGAGTGTNDASAIAFAITSLGASGGRVIIDMGFKCLIGANLNIPDNVIIEGEANGDRGDFNDAESNLLGWTPALYVDPTYTITVNSASGIRNLAIFRKGLQFNITAAQVASTFAGSAITLGDYSCDATLEYLTILGFQYGIRTLASNHRANRVNINRVNLDCLNGIYLENAADTSSIYYVHGWPFVTVGSAVETNNAQLLRSGTFIHIGGTINDWCDVAHCFGYGHAIEFRAADSVNSVSFTNCGADHVSGLSDGAIGFQVDGSAREIRIISPQIAAKQYGINVNSNYSSVRIVAAIVNPSIWSTTTAAVLVDDGDVDISEGFMRTGASAIKTTANAGKVVVDGTDFRAFTTVFDNYATTVQLRHRNCSFASNTTIATNPYVPSVASGSSIVLDGESLHWTVTGTTNCGTLSPVAAYAGKTVTLKFGGSLTVITGGNMNLAGAANFSATDKDTISLYSDGSAWYETGRSVN